MQNTNNKNEIFNPLKGIIEKKIAQYFSPRFQIIINKMQEHYKQMESKCENASDIALLNKIFRKVNMKGFDIYFPKEKAVFTVRELKRMSDIWFQFDNNSERSFDVKTKKWFKRIWFFKTKEVILWEELVWWDTWEVITEKEMDTKLEWSFFENAYPELFKDYHIAQKELKDMFSSEHRQEFAQWYNEIAEDIKNQISQMWRWKLFDPKKELLTSPKIIDTLYWNILSNPWIVNNVLLSKNDSQVLTLQTRWILPSIFNESSLELVTNKTYHFVVLIDISWSTQEEELYKYIDIAWAQLKYTLSKKIKNSHVIFIPYNVDAEEILTEINGFIYPEWDTDRNVAFEKAMEYLKTKRWHKTILNVWDWLPNSLNKAIEKAQEIAKAKISYGQIIFPHNLERYKEDVRNQVLELLWLWVWINEDDDIDWNEYPEYYFKVAQAANGWQIVVPSQANIAQWLLWLADLSIWKSFKPDDNWEDMDDWLDWLLSWLFSEQ